MQSSERNPRVTIVIPCYNQGDFLADCLTSIRAQSFDAWEVIVVDDASTSGDPAGIVAGFAEPRFKLIRHRYNQGLGAARNTGFRAAITELVLPVDSDDKLEPTFLDVTVRALEARPDAVHSMKCS